MADDMLPSARNKDISLSYKYLLALLAMLATDDNIRGGHVREMISGKGQLFLVISLAVPTLIA